MKLKILLDKINNPCEEKIIIKGKKYKENLPLQSAKVRPTRIIENIMKNIITFIENIFFGLVINPKTKPE